MRTPKEEAKELVDRFSVGYMNFEETKKCAIICVDKILDAVTTIADKKFEHYTEVKQEIEKLKR